MKETMVAIPLFPWTSARSPSPSRPHFFVDDAALGPSTAVKLNHTFSSLLGHVVEGCGVDATNVRTKDDVRQAEQLVVLFRRLRDKHVESSTSEVPRAQALGKILFDDES